ncbi:hypothetical protein NQZ79_g7583 [Umbelopsis isabellina]|nr:hypothetical protein NQZ79_g7583 [Umbelopsis isabellina]
MNDTLQFQLLQQLLPLLLPLSSEEHQRALIDNNIMTPQQPRKMDYLLKQLRKHPTSSTVDAIVQECVHMTDQLRTNSDKLGHPSFTEQQLLEISDAWQIVGEEYDKKAQEQQEESQSMLDGLAALVRQWKAPQNIENIVATIISNQPGSLRLVQIDKHNYYRLGLSRHKVGQKYVVLETRDREEQTQQVQQIGQDFSYIFAENAKNNLERLDQTYRYQGDINLREKMRVLLQHTTSHQHHHHINNNYKLERIKFAATKMPNFAPAEWQWPDLVKVRHPYQPLLLGLYRNRTKQQKETQISTLSVRKLCEHFRKTGCEFYTSILDSATLLYSSDTKIMSQEGKQFLSMSVILQIEQTRSTLRKALVVLHQLRQAFAQQTAQPTSAT